MKEQLDYIKIQLAKLEYLFEREKYSTFINKTEVEQILSNINEALEEGE